MVAMIATAFVAAIHAYFVYLEMFRWQAPRTRKIFGTTAEFALESKILAANQGLYNGFLSIGLFLGILMGAAGKIMVIYLLICVLIAGIYGGITATRSAFVVQSIPAKVALLAFYVGI